MTHPPAKPNRSPGTDITHIHHLGHVVADMRAAVSLYERLGFKVSPPSYPAMEAGPGQPPRAFGVGNARIFFPRNFLELATAWNDQELRALPEDAELIPLQAAPEARAAIAAQIELTADRLRDALAQREGLHILVLGSQDIDASARRLSRAGVAHRGVVRLTRRGGTDEGEASVPVAYLEIDHQHGSTPEGRISVADGRPVARSGALEHPNGAIDLCGATLCVPDQQLTGAVQRYQRYSQRSAQTHDGAQRLGLDNSELIIVPRSTQSAILPIERPPVSPAFVACTVTVADLCATEALLRSNNIPTQRIPPSALVVPASAALGVNVVFREL